MNYMEISVPLLSALVAALISLVVGVLTFVATSRSLANQRRMQERELDRRFTQRLYDLRLDSYPRAFEITDRLRGDELFSPSLTVSDLEAVARDLNEWYRTKAAFVLSDDSMKAWYAIKGVLAKKPAPDGHHSEESRQAIWHAKNRLRAALRADINLLYIEEAAVHCVAGKNAP